MLLNGKTPVIPGDLSSEFNQIASLAENGWTEHRITMNSHFGTHIDFPLHFVENGKTQNDFDIGHFIGNGYLVDARGQKKIYADLSQVKAGDILLLWTGKSQDLSADNYFSGSPVISDEMAQEIVDRRIRMVCLDAWSPDKEPYTIHQKLLKNDILLVENLIHFDRLQNKKFKLFVAPLRLDLFDGCPCRVFAEVEEEGETNGEF